MGQNRQGCDTAESKEWILDGTNVHFRRRCNEELAKGLVYGMVNLELVRGALVKPIGFDDLCGCGGTGMNKWPWLHRRDARDSCHCQILDGAVRTRAKWPWTPPPSVEGMVV
eukprot:scaffold88199_cov40-Attheya_sp.AAC.2